MMSPRTQRRSSKHVSGPFRNISKGASSSLHGRIPASRKLPRATHVMWTRRTNLACEQQSAPSLSSAPPPSTTMMSALSVSLASWTRVTLRRTAWRSVSHIPALTLESGNNCTSGSVAAYMSLGTHAISISSLPPCPLRNPMRRTQAVVPAQISRHARPKTTRQAVSATIRAHENRRVYVLFLHTASA